VTVTKEITRLEKSSLKLSITVAKDDVRMEYNDLLSNYAKSIQIPGFRKGKVPNEVLIRKFGDALKDEARGKIIEKSIESIFGDEAFPRESKPLPYSTPRLENEPKLDLESDLQFSFVYDVLPEVKVGKWQGLEAEIPDVSIGDEDIARELEGIRERNSIVLDKNEGENAAKGDVVTVNYCELGDSGEALAGTEREDFSFTLGSGHNTYKFDDEIIGMKKGETKAFSKSYPNADNDYKESAKKLKVTITALKEKKLPDLDDDLAQDVDEKFQTLEDLKNDIHQRLNKDLERKLREIKLSKLLERIMENTPVEIPESMLRMELDSRWRNLARQFNTDTGGLYKTMGEKAESIIEGWKPVAIKALHSRLIVETLIEDLKLEASEEDVEKDIEKIAAESETELEEVKKYYEDGQMREYLKEDIKEQKLLDLLFEKNTIKTGIKANYVDLAVING